MIEEMNERKGVTGKVLLMLLIVAVVIGVLWATGLIRWEESSKEIATVEDNPVSTTEGQFTVSEEEWLALKNDVEQLHQEVNQLKSSSNKTATSKSQAPTAHETVPTQPAKKPTSNASATQDPNALNWQTTITIGCNQTQLLL